MRSGFRLVADLGDSWAALLLRVEQRTSLRLPVQRGTSKRGGCAGVPKGRLWSFLPSGAVSTTPGGIAAARRALNTPSQGGGGPLLLGTRPSAASVSHCTKSRGLLVRHTEQGITSACDCGGDQDVDVEYFQCAAIRQIVRHGGRWQPNPRLDGPAICSPDAQASASGCRCAEGRQPIAGPVSSLSDIRTSHLNP